MADVLSDADRLLAHGHVRDAVDLIAQAAGNDDRDALFRLGFWRVVGEPLQRDLPAARRSLRRAAALGHAEAQLMDVALTANGSGGPPDWPSALSHLEKVAGVNAAAAASFSLVSKMAIDAVGRPLRPAEPEPLVENGAIGRVEALLTPEECAHIARSAADALAPSVVIEPKTGRSIRNPIRTSEESIIGPLREDLAIRAINLRIAAASGTDVAQGEALTVLRYRPGQQFRLHHDAIGHTTNERAKTVIIYLNENFTGGETVFPAYGLTITPRGGDAILFRNTLPDGDIDRAAHHAGEPVRQGVKWIATRWIRSRAYDPWAGPESASQRRS